MALARAVAPARHAAAAFLVVFAALLAVSTTAQAQTTGICGRTAAVRTAILGKISGVSNCASVTDAHLTAITGTLNLSNKGITALAAGDFDKLTALTRLYLDSNSLTTLPAGVFDGLTALTELQLYNNSLSTLPAGVFDKLTSLTILDLGANSLTTLPAGVFDELTALEDLRLDRNSLTTLPDGVFDELTALEDLRLGVNDLSTLPAGMFDKLTSLTSLYLFDNQLATLPAGVFDELTSLTSLQLQGNSGAPFSPTAVALPDDGTVLDAGGDVTLDGSGSDGGPWGTNVTYSWAASGATVTFDDAASATPVVTIPALADGTELTFTLTVTGRATDASYGTAPDTDTATVTATNAAPAFTSSATFSAAENQTAAGTVEASDSDTGDSVTGYEIQGGADQSAFSIVDRGRERGADVQVGAELRGRDGRRRQQHVRGGGAGDQRHGRAGEDGGPDDHGDGDGRGRRGAGRPGRADGVGGVGEQRDGGLGRARERRAADHGLRLPVPGEVDGSGMDGGDEHDDHGVERDDHGARGGHGVRGAGAGDQRRGHERLVRPGQRLDGRERGAGVHLVGDVQRGGEPDRGGDGRGVGQRHGRQRDGL